jgi:hypothetical protein
MNLNRLTNARNWKHLWQNLSGAFKIYVNRKR